METVPHWTRVWRVITGRSLVTTADVIDDALELLQQQLLKGITTYPAFTEESFIKCSEKVELKDHAGLSKFIRQISITLNLDACIAWSIFCNYLIFEYYGKVEDMQAVLRDDSATEAFITSIWQFYTLERTYILRTLQYVLENHRNVYHKFNIQYSKFIDDITYKNLREYLFDQLQHLTKEISQECSTVVIEMNDLVERNNAELLQTLLLILITIQHERFGIAEFLKMFKLSKEHMFAPSSQQQEILKLSRPQILENMRSAEIAVFIASIDSFWHNMDEWYSHIDEIEKLMKEILPSENVSIILLTWAALQTTLPEDLAKMIYEQHSHMYVSKALENYVFVDLRRVVSNSIFQRSIVGVVAKISMFKLFEILCTQFEPYNVYTHEGAVSLLSQFLSFPEVAFAWKDMEGISAFVLNASLLFPHHFEPLSNIMKSFISLKEDTLSVLQKLCNLNTFTEKYSSPEQNGPYIKNNYLMHLYKPLGNNLIVFPSGSWALITEKYEEPLIEIHAEWNYFGLLIYVVNNFLDRVELEQQYDEPYQKIVLAGYQVILEILKVDPDWAWENADVKKLMRLALCLLSISAKSQTKNLEVMKMCFEMSLHMFKREPADIVRALVAIDFLPKLSHEDIAPVDFSKSYLLSQATLFRHIQDEFPHSNSCDLLLLYIQFINEAIQKDIYYTKLQIPGCMFLLGKVFPVFVKQLFSDDHQKQTVLVDLINLIHNILKKDPISLAEPDAILYDCVTELFLTNKTYSKCLMKIVACGNNKVQLLLTTEMNWQDGPVLLVVEAIKTALECVLLLLNFAKSKPPGKYHLFEELLYWWEPSSYSTLKIISSYMNHCFHPEIPKLACKILTAFVKVSNSPLLHSLQLDDYQLQSLFLERLRDSLDDQEMRVDVVKLVTACISEQSSMTSAFFNMSPKEEYSDVGILSFLEDYLKSIERNPNSLLISIQAAVLDLLHELWKTNKQHLLKKMTDQESFWVSLITPLLKPNHVPIEALLQILEIVVLELHFSKANIHEKFSKGFKTLFENPKEFLKLWVERLTQISHDETLLSDSSRLPLCTALLTIWKNFVLSVKLLNPDYFDREWNKPFFLKWCLAGLLRYTEKPKAVEVLTLWAELLLVFVNFPTVESNTEKKEIFTCLTEIVTHFSKVYAIPNSTCRTVLLTVFTIIVTNFKDFLVTNSTLILPFLKPFRKIFYYEYKFTFMEKSLDENHYRNWVLVLCIIRTCLEFDTLSDCEDFFTHMRFVERVTEVLGLCIVHSLPVRVAEVTAMSLVQFAETPLIQHFEHLNLLLINEQLLPPKTLILQANCFPNGIIPQHLKDWWTIYLHIVRLHCTLLRRRKGYVSKYSLEFVSVHHTILADALLSATVLADSSNLKLVNEILRFVYAVLEYRQEWTLFDYPSFCSIMITIKEVLNAAIGVLLRPKCVIFVPNNLQSPKMQVESVVPTQNLVSVTNSYLEIIAWTCKCFTRCNPPFIKLLDMYRPTDFKVFIEYDFRVPTAMEKSTQILTYGSLLCALHFVCKVLSQMFFQEKERSSESSLTTPKGDGSSAPTTSSASTPTPTSETPSTKSKAEQYFNVLILPIYTKETAESISVLHSFTVPDIGLQAPWLINLNTDTLLSTLNALTTFLAGQAFLTVHDDGIERNLKRYVKRELCSELSLFYDFVIKYLSDKYAPTEEEQITPGGTDIRVMATPRRAHSKSRIKSRDKVLTKTCSETKLVVDILRICTDRQSGRRTEIPDVEDCYLLTLVHWFRHVCRLVHYSKFDEFLSRWHAKSTYVMPHSTFVKNTSVHLSDEEDEMC